MWALRGHRGRESLLTAGTPRASCSAGTLGHLVSTKGPLGLKDGLVLRQFLPSLSGR